MSVGRPTLRIYSPAGVLRSSAPLIRAGKRLDALGYAVESDESASERSQRFAGGDHVRLDAIHRTAAARPDVAMASRGCSARSTGGASPAASMRERAGSATAT